MKYIIFLFILTYSKKWLQEQCENELLNCKETNYNEECLKKFKEFVRDESFKKIIKSKNSYELLFEYGLLYEDDLLTCKDIFNSTIYDFFTQYERIDLFLCISLKSFIVLPWIFVSIIFFVFIFFYCKESISIIRNLD